MKGKVRALLLGILLFVGLALAGACRDPLDLPRPDPQPVEPFK